MKDLIKNLYEEMQEDLSFYEEIGTPAANRLGGALKSIKGIMLRLKAGVLADGFKDDREEVHFFKYEKPLFVAAQIYLTEYATIYLGKPSLSNDLLHAYYEEELKRIQVFINRFGFLYQCYKLEASDLDSVLFLRGAGPTGMLLPGTPDADPAFSTNGDYLWAKFRAYERLQEYLLGALNAPEGSEPFRFIKRKGKPLKWTGDKSNLIEVAYGLFETGQLNDGKATITDVVEWLEDTLEINLSRYYRRFTEIKMRKSISPTKYLEEMRDAVLKRIEEGDAWRGK